MLDEYKFIPKGKIYKYCCLEKCREILEKGELNFENPRYFNDPFDCNISILKFSRSKQAETELMRAISEQPISQVEQIKLFKEIWDNDQAEKCWRESIELKVNAAVVCCFSKVYDNILMWSHYSYKHKGVCLEFDAEFEFEKILLDVTPDMFVNVDYSEKENVEYNFDKREGVIYLFSNKSKVWEYEKEVRLIVIGKKKKLKFNPDFLIGLIFGCRTNDDDINEIIKLANEKGYKLEFKRAIKDNFNLRFEGK